MAGATLRSKSKRPKGTTTSSPPPTQKAKAIPNASLKVAKQPPFPLAAVLWSARAGMSVWVVLSLTLMIAALFRWAVGLWGYSGHQAPPMYGDFEAQRHWMEVTTNLPITHWYFHDLEWWGLDYPPLTAYHSWVLGKIGSWINPGWFALYKSRGLEDPALKVFMRATVLISEYLIYVPALIFLTRRLMRIYFVDAWDSAIALVAILMQPGVILVDHGHFQYNTVMLGFVVAAISSFCVERWLWCCVFFVAALGFKQMALYYAPAMFACLLGACIWPRVNALWLLRIAAVTGVSFLLLVAPLLAGALWHGAFRHGDSISEKSVAVARAPFLPPWLAAAPFLADPARWYFPLAQQLAQCVHRVFPFARGIFEDKVANVWCVLNVFVKLRARPPGQLQRAALAATAAAIAPPCAVLFLRPRGEALLYGFAATAWGFFLCSFQVHEKSVLLPLLPMTLLLAQRDGLAPAVRAWAGFANVLGAWTMYPLLKRDGLRVPYAVVTLLWAYLLGLPPTSAALYARQRQQQQHQGSNKHNQNLSVAAKVQHSVFYVAMVAWHAVDAVVAPPPTKPDLWVLLNAAVGAAGFGLCYLWCLYQAVMRSGLLGKQQPRKKTR